MTRKEYIESVLSALCHVTRREREAIQAEIDAHIEDHMADLLELDYPLELAGSQTLILESQDGSQAEIRVSGVALMLLQKMPQRNLKYWGTYMSVLGKRVKSKRAAYAVRSVYIPSCCQIFSANLATRSSMPGSRSASPLSLAVSSRQKSGGSQKPLFMFRAETI